MRVKCELKAAKSEISAGRKRPAVWSDVHSFCRRVALVHRLQQQTRGVGKPLETVIGRGGRREVFVVATVESVRRDAEQLDDRLRDGKNREDLSVTMASRVHTRIPNVRLSESRTLFGSRMRTYLPSGCLSARSAIVRTIPHPLAKLTFIWPAKSRGLYHCEPRIVCREASRGFAREM